MAKRKKFVQNDNNIAITYLRYSSHAQNDASIEQQRELAEQLANDKGLTIVKHFEDRAISGRTENRPGFQSMLSEIGKIKPAALITWKTDRLGRDRYTLAITKRTIRDAGCQIHYVSDIDPDDSPESAIIEGVLEAAAEMESRKTSQNVTRGMRYNAKNALYNGHKILGYKVNENKKYVIDPDKASVVQRIYEDYASGKPLVEIANSLNEQGIKTSRDKKFTVNSLNKTLKLEAYLGIYKYSDIVIEGGMPALVTQELFDKAQARLALNKRKGSQRANGLDEDNAPRYWLTGKLFCGHCGSTMQGTSGTSKTKGKIHRYYDCANKRKGKCHKKSVRKSFIETLVTEVLAEVLNDSENVASLAVDAAAYYKKYHSDIGYLEGLQASKKEVEKALSNIMKAIEQGIFSETTQARLLELEAQKNALGEAIETEQIKKNMMQDEHSIQSYFNKYLNADFLNPETREYILEYFIDKIYVYDDRLVITGKYYEGEHTITWDELRDMEEAEGFDSSVFSSTINIKPLVDRGFSVLRRTVHSATVNHAII